MEEKVGLEGCSLPNTKAGIKLAQARPPGAPLMPKHQILNVSGFMGSISPRSDIAQLKEHRLRRGEEGMEFILTIPRSPVASSGGQKEERSQLR